MSFRTTVAIIITIGLTVLILQNMDEGVFTILFVSVKVPKLAVITAASVGGFLLGILVSRPKKPRYPNAPSYPDDNNQARPRLDTLSDEDREYIS